MSAGSAKIRDEAAGTSAVFCRAVEALVGCVYGGRADSWTGVAATCDSDTGGADSCFGAGLLRGLGGVADEGSDGRRDRECYGERVCSGSTEGEQGGVLLQREERRGLQQVDISAGGEWGLLVGAA